MDIKQEEADFHHNLSPHSDSEGNIGSLSNILHVDSESDKAEERDLNDFYLDLLQSDRDCETCLKYMRMLSQHVKITHAPHQPIQDPLYIDPLDIDPLDTDPGPPQAQQSLFIQIKGEMDDFNVKMELCSDEESKSDSENIDFNIESESDHDHDLPLPNQSSSIQIKSVVDKGNVELESSDSEGESALNSDPDYNTENDGENDPDFSPSHSLTQKPRRQSQGSVKNHALSESGRSKTEKGFAPTRGKWKCHVCGEGFRLMINLKEHMSLHGGEKAFKCGVCVKRFTTKTHLKEHMKVHTREKPFKCGVCEKSFVSRNHLTRHNVSHTGEKPFQCDECDMCFSLKTSLTRHMRRHTGERPYECRVCKKTFVGSYDLTTHGRVHTGERPYKCGNCEKTFITSGHLTQHKKTSVSCVGALNAHARVEPLLV